MLPPNNLGPDESGVSVNETLFRDMIGSLMYLTASRPDIQFSTYIYARHQANPKESHLVIVKRFFRYLKGTPNLVCWSAKKQSSVAMSSAKAEYVAVVGCCDQVLWIKSQMADYDVAKLLPEPIKSLIHPSKDVDINDTINKSLSGTTMQPVTQSKAQTDKNTKRKRIPPSSKPKASKNSLGASKSAKEQGNQPNIVDAKKNTEPKVTLTQSKEDIADNILDEMADLKAFADKPSDPLGHLRPEISSLSNKVDNLESSLAKKVSSKLEESVPRMALPKFDQMVQETMQSTVSELIRKPLNKELNALNTLETQRFASLQKELLEKGDVNLWELINLMKDMVHLLDSASVFRKANAKGEK
ncbi:hypothetical protein Tco_1056224 [Tanacetum coccineum]|uniref:Uncharacterized protein n=1 Tax=Tanacetum coccineum TaxID=301880 RepID=A0ABQ5H3P0_9ASTR